MKHTVSEVSDHIMSDLHVGDHDFLDVAIALDGRAWCGHALSLRDFGLYVEHDVTVNVNSISTIVVVQCLPAVGFDDPTLAAEAFKVNFDNVTNLEIQRANAMGIDCCDSGVIKSDNVTVAIRRCADPCCGIVCVVSTLAEESRTRSGAVTVKALDAGALDASATADSASAGSSA
jgi:hypothetical protein